MIRGRATLGTNSGISFEGIREQKVHPHVKEDELQPAVARFRAGTVQCQKGGPLKAGNDCVRCPRMVNLYPEGDRLTIRCLWTEQDRVSQLMTLAHLLVFVPSVATVERAREIAINARIHHLMVVDDGYLTGIACMCDLAAEAQPHETVAHRASHVPWVIDESATLAEAANLMIDRQIGCLPVVRGRELRGVITRTDLQRIGVDVYRLGADVSEAAG